MLVLSRKAGEKIYIGNDITITVVRIGPCAVRIGIEAPKNVNVVRSEITRHEIDINLSEGQSLDVEQLAALTGLGG
ncbi:carbon storage regulator [Schlesneria sp. DSM 10557]|uniref:carbon storage regulator n=1 Tax=Schlesneria sp. DSM 10557 TaxID=3044399 RepID=UPI0035A03A06